MTEPLVDLELVNPISHNVKIIELYIEYCLTYMSWFLVILNFYLEFIEMTIIGILLHVTTMRFWCILVMSLRIMGDIFKFFGL